MRGERVRIIEGEFRAELVREVPRAADVPAGDGMQVPALGDAQVAGELSGDSAGCHDAPADRGG